MADLPSVYTADFRKVEKNLYRFGKPTRFIILYD